MEILTIKETIQKLARVLAKPCMYISFIAGDFVSGISSIRAAPYLSLKEHGQLITEGEGILIFEDNAEMEHYYKMTIGDDGPTELNPYNGIYRVYALCCSADGEFLYENT